MLLSRYLVIGSLLGYILTGDGRYEDYYARFKSIFPIREGTPVYHIPGNHDVG